MKTVSTKLSKEDFEKFQEMCNSEGQCMSEEIRELIKMGIDAYEDGLQIENEKQAKLNASNSVIKYIEDTKPTELKHPRIVYMD